MFNILGTFGFCVAVKCIIAMDGIPLLSWMNFWYVLGFAAGMTIYERSRGLE